MSKKYFVQRKSLGHLAEEGAGRLIISIGTGKFKEELYSILSFANTQAFDIGFEEGKAYMRALARSAKPKKKKKK